jgi:hypothetical protein
MFNSKRFNLIVEKTKDVELVRVTWIDEIGRKHNPYLLIRDRALNKATSARDALKEVGNAYRNLQGDYDKSLRNLANHGRAVRDSLFSDGPPEYKQQMGEIRKWFESWSTDVETKIKLAVTVDPNFQIPWGVLHDFGSKDMDPSVLYEGFWAIRYNVSALYNGFPPLPFRKTIPQEELMHLAAVDLPLFNRVTGFLDAQNVNLINGLLNRPVGQAFSTEGCKKRWKQACDNDCVISFFAHGSGKQIQISRDDQISASDFRDIFERESIVVKPHNSPVTALSLLNGCDTSAGDGYNSFLVATADPGFCGFVGVEATVPDRFALLFGQEFLHSVLISGRSVGETIQELWHKHYPMSLFYGNYADPDFRVEAADPIQVPEDFETRNLSYDLRQGEITNEDT